MPFHTTHQCSCVTVLQAGAPEPAKFLGHGVCDNHSRSVTLGRYIKDAADVYEQAALLLLAMRLPVEEIRGMGITVCVCVCAFSVQCNLYVK